MADKDKPKLGYFVKGENNVPASPEIVGPVKPLQRMGYFVAADDMPDHVLQAAKKAVLPQAVLPQGDKPNLPEIPVRPPANDRTR